jgi:hypothetical protein
MAVVSARGGGIVDRRRARRFNSNFTRRGGREQGQSRRFPIEDRLQPVLHPGLLFVDDAPRLSTWLQLRWQALWSLSIWN